MKTLLTGLFLIISLVSQADYLKLYRNTSIKKEAKSSGTPVMKVAEGALLILLDSGEQTYGYYHVQYPASNITGYIYRTLVKRMPGVFPVYYNTNPAVEITIIDVGAGLSVYIKLPNGEVVVYDAGLYNRAYDYIKNKYPIHSEIDYLVLSHTDADHWGSTKELVENYSIKNILRTDLRLNKRSATLNDGVSAIEKMVPVEYDWNISERAIQPGTLFYEKDGVKLFFMMGFGSIPDIDEWRKLSVSKKNNGVSIVMKLVYGEHSILFTGDAVGRNDGKDGCIASEKFMLDTLSADLIDADILIAAHHGADNGSCLDFIRAVSPEYVVFSAGHKHHHPNLSTANRFIKNYGISKNNLYRTDTYDYEPGGDNPYQQEWNYPFSNQNNDIAGDDHIKIVFPLNGNIQIGYELEN